MKSISALLLLAILGAAPCAFAKEKDKDKDKDRWRSSTRVRPHVPPVPPVPPIGARGGSTTTDTTVSVSEGTHFTLENFAGDIIVRAWDKNSVRVQASHNSRTWVELSRDEGNLSVEAGSRRGFPVSVDYEINVPTWMPVELSGVNSEITVEGSKSDVKVETVSGNVTVTGGSGMIELSSVQGMVQLSGARGKIEASAVNDGISISNVNGELEVSAINGDVVMDRVESSNVNGSTMNGMIFYNGTLKSGGHYHFDSNNGEIKVGIPDGTGINASVSTYGGHFHSTFPVSLTKTRRGKRSTFTLGSGGAELELESFQGRVELFRPGEVPVPKLQAHEDGDEEETGDEDGGNNNDNNNDNDNDNNKDKDE